MKAGVNDSWIVKNTDKKGLMGKDNVNGTVMEGMEGGIYWIGEPTRRNSLTGSS